MITTPIPAAEALEPLAYAAGLFGLFQMRSRGFDLMQHSAVGFGDFLLLMVDRLNEESVTQDDVIDCLQQITEAFDRELNPAVEYEAYAALRLCQAILRVHERP